MPPKDDIFSVLDASIAELQERDIVMITCKVLSIHQGRCLKKDGTVTRAELGRRESDWYIDYGEAEASERHIPTIRNHTFLGSAGVDASNGDGYFMLPPLDVSALCAEIRAFLQQKFGVRELGVMAVDSHTLPFRYGVTGVALGLWGFEPMRKYTQAQDIFGGTFRETVNVADALAGATTLLFGEGDEKTPILIARAVPGIAFCDHESFASLCVPEDKDIFSPIFRGFVRNTQKNV